MSTYVRHWVEEPLLPTSVSGLTSVYASSVVAQSYDSSLRDFIGDRHVMMSIEKASVGARAAFGIDDINADSARGTFKMLVHVDSTRGSGDGTAYISLGGRCSGASATATGYFAELRAATVALVKAVAGTDTDLATAAYAGFAGGLSVGYYVRFEVSGTTTVTLNMKVWADTAAEPAGWTVTTTDAASPIAGPGLITIGGKQITGHSPANYRVTFACVGTGGDACPERPVLWSEYLAFLKQQDTLRCILFEAEVLGQDAGGGALTAKVCASNIPFVSNPADKYPNVAYEEILLEAPTVKRRMNDVLRGRSTIAFGDAKFKNESTNEDGSGRLDAWTDWNWDGRASRTLLGHPSWRRCDFKTHFLGVSQDIQRSARGQMTLKFRGPDALLQRPLTTALIGGTGPNAAKLVPWVSGSAFNIEPLVYDANNLVYQVAQPMANIFGDNSHDVRDAGVSLKKATRTVSSVTGNVITADAAHGMLVGATIVFTSGTPPAPLVLNRPYYVIATGFTTTAFSLSFTAGGAQATLTNTTAGASFVPRNYQFGTAGSNGDDGRITLLVSPTGKITADLNLATGSSAQTVILAAAQQSGAFASWSGASQFVFAGNPQVVLPLTPIGVYYKETISVGQVIDDICQSVGASWNPTRVGALTLTVLDIPSSTADFSIVSDDVRNWQPAIRFLPADPPRLGFQTNYTQMSPSELQGSVSVLSRDLYAKPYSVGTYSPSESGLERPDNHVLHTTPGERTTKIRDQADAQAEAQREYNLNRKVCGTYTFATDAQALAWELGKVLGITYPRDGFTNGKNAVVVGLTENPARDKVDVEVFCQIDGQWPVVTATNPMVPEAYY